MLSLLIVFILSIVALIAFVVVMIVGFNKTNRSFWFGIVGMIISIFIALAEFWKEASSFHSTDYDTVLKWMKEMENKDE